jgi:hypothetical protein
MKPQPSKRRRKDAPPKGKDEGATTTTEISEDCPVVIQFQTYKEKKGPPPITLDSNIDDFLYPMTTESFLQNCLRRRAVHITCATGDETTHADQRVSVLRQEMCNLDAKTILRETSSDNIFVWLRSKDGSTASEANHRDLIHSIEVGDADTAIALHKTAGHATYCRAPPKVEQRLVSTLLRGTGLGCGQYDPSGESMISMGSGEVETFISTDGHVTNWHYDFQENFTIQLSGIKRWTIQQGAIQNPIRGCTPHYASPETVESQLKAASLCDRKFRFGYPEKGVNAIGDVATIDVKPGDVFYFPAGMWHKVETIEPGVSINVSLMATNYATVTCQALQHFLLKDKRWSHPILNNGVNDAVGHLKQLLKDLPEKIRELEQDGKGAGSILPPVLRYPPRFQVEAGDGWEDAQGDSDGEDIDDDNEEMEETTEPDEEKKEDGDGGNNGGDNEDLEFNDVIDPQEFDGYPEDWDLDVESGTELTRNPLASLHRLDEINTFYKGKRDGEDKIFVLNMNFAGNEMHQSAVRVMFKDDDSGTVNRLYNLERNDEGNSMELSRNEMDGGLVKFLVYHGYLQG